MVQVSYPFLLALAAASVSAAPMTLMKRIAQVIADSTAKWEQACLTAGGGQQCNPLSVTAFTTLLAAAGPCEQQDAADNMIDLAKTLNNDAEMIRLTQIFVQQPRNTPNSVAVPYCQKASRNAELNGLFQCQFEGANQQTFVGTIPLGQPGTIPFGKSAPLDPLGSCVAHPDGPIADGTQLVDQVSSPGGVGSSNNAGSGATIVTETAPAVTVTQTASQSASQSASTSSTSGDFRLQNAKDAQALNAKFASLTEDSACADGDQACIKGGFAQCVSGKFVITSCAGGTQCVALPLVNKPGTSLTCDTAADAIARMQAAGASASLTGSGGSTSSSSSNTVSNAAAPPESKPATSSSSTSGNFRLQNAKDAQALNAKFASLTADSSCQDGEQACINGGFAQCVGGQFTITACAGGTQCVALPLVNKQGTSLTCDTQADAIARMQDAGASASLTG